MRQLASCTDGCNKMHRGGGGGICFFRKKTKDVREPVPEANQRRRGRNTDLQTSE